MLSTDYTCKVEHCETLWEENSTKLERTERDGTAENSLLSSKLWRKRDISRSYAICWYYQQITPWLIPC